MKNNAKVRIARLHEDNFVPELKRTFDRTLDPKALPGLEMTLCPAGVECHFENTVFIVPYVNFKNIVLEKEEPKAESKKEAA